MAKDFSDTTIGTRATLRDAMTLMDKSGQGVVFILDEQQVLLGLLTDGDIRRSFLSGAGMESKATEYMNRNFIAGLYLAEAEENLALLNDRIRCLPVLDAEGRIHDMLRWKDFYRLPVMEPVLKGHEFEYVTDCLATNWISSQGKYVERFESSFRSYHPVKYALSVSNGTAALHLAMAALGIGPGDEIIIPDLTFVSPASMALLCGAKPVFVDVDVATWTMDPSLIEERISPATKAIVPVHLYGHPCDMDPIMEIARKNNLFVIEDCAEALGAEYKGQKVGTIGHVGAYSFFANKVITTGEGGMVTTNDPELCRQMKLRRDHGMTPERRYWHQVAGFNYRLTNLQAAIGLAQMERIDTFLDDRGKVVARYDDQLGKIPGITLPPRNAWAKNIYWLYSIVIDEEQTGIGRDSLMAQLKEHGIDTRPFFYPLHQQPPFLSEADKQFPNSVWLAENGLSLPTSNNITLEDVDRVCAAIKSVIKHSSFFDQYTE